MLWTFFDQMKCSLSLIVSSFFFLLQFYTHLAKLWGGAAVICPKIFKCYKNMLDTRVSWAQWYTVHLFYLAKVSIEIEIGLFRDNLILLGGILCRLKELRVVWILLRLNYILLIFSSRYFFLNIMELILPKLVSFVRFVSLNKNCNSLSQMFFFINIVLQRNVATFFSVAGISSTVRCANSFNIYTDFGFNFSPEQ